MRIAIVGLSIEIMMASPVRTGKESLQQFSPQQMLDGEIWMVRGMMARLREEPAVEIVPLLWVTALPGGMLTADAYAGVKAETLALLKANGPFDGVLVANHGALEAEGLTRDADTDFIVAIRDLVGPDVPIGVALDLHGDMTPELLEAATVFSVLRTAPHRDDKSTGYRAADQLLTVIRRKLRPAKAAVRIPMLIPGEIATTTNPPADALYGSLPDYDAKPGLMEANILLGFAWNDRPWTASTVFAVSEGDPERAKAEALHLAAAFWARRDDFKLRMETAEVAEGIARAAAAAEAPIFLSDAGDNTTAGAAGDLTTVLQAALDRPDVAIAVPGITAPKTVAALVKVGVGATVTIELGAEHLSRPKTSRQVEVVVEAAEPALRLEGFQPYRSSEFAWARVRIGKTVATFHERAIGVTTPAHLRALGVDPATQRIIVVKLGYLHPQLEDIAGRHILLLSDGTAQPDVTRLAWKVLKRPAWPLDGEFPWRPEDGLYQTKR